MTQELFIIRGLPGSGKTTFARKLVNTAAAQNINMMHNEADNFHEHIRMDENGVPQVVYDFNRKLLGAAHDYCYGATIRALAEGHSAVVSNTFTTKREIDRYVNGVRRCGFNGVVVRVLKMTTQYESTHDVPASVIVKMAERWEDYAGELEITENSNG